VASALDAVGEIVEFSMFPYGNARQSKNGDLWTFTCQHGKDECVANMYEACAIDISPNTTSWWPMVLCMEKASSPVNAAQGCATSAGLDWSAIAKCAGDDPSVGSADHGNPLMHKIADATNNLQPAHQFTPWIVMNGRPLSSSKLGGSLIPLICAAYTGTKPAGCSVQAAAPRSFPVNLPGMGF